jgi:carbon monoxide dehydrogenase subunit G
VGFAESLERKALAMLKFEGDKDFPQAVADVWKKLTDARFLVQCVPDVESVSRSEPDHVVCVLRPGFSFIRGTLELTLQVADAVENTSARLVLHSKGIGSTSDVEATLALMPQDAGTRLHWTAEIKNLGGLLKPVPQGLVKASAQKIIAGALTSVEAKLKD